MERDPPPQREDEIPEDDAIIGRVFRWSLVVIVLVVLAGFAGLRLMRRAPVAEAAIAKDLEEVRDLDPNLSRMPDARFVDITAESGIDFVHTSGARGEKLLPETMGGGVAFFDYDGDSDQDLFLVNSDEWSGAQVGGPRPAPALFRNDGRGRFENVTSAAGLKSSLYGMGAAVGDYDNDGDVDLFVTALGPNRLFRNDGGRFRDVTSAAGVAGEDSAWSTSAGFLDYDNDGDLDLFVCNYVRWSKQIDLELNFTLNGKDRAYGPPTNYEGVHPYLYRNEGGGRFRDVSSESGIQVVNPLMNRPVAKALALTFFDYDRDGFLDVFVANDTVQNFLFHNRRDGTFEERGVAAGVAFDSAGSATGAMGIDAAHYRNDEQIAVGIGNFSNEMTSFYVSRDRGLLFTDEAAGEGIGSPSRQYMTFGLCFFDFDLDGRLDLLQANGHLEEEINQVQVSQHYRQPAQLFWNAGPAAGSCYTEVPADKAGGLSQPIVGRGAAFADIDGDGDLDVLLSQTGGPPLLLRNDQDLSNHWLRIELIGTHSNRDAIGAWIELTAAGEVQSRQVMPTRSYLSQVELPVTFGLGASGRIDSVLVVWPGGRRQALGDFAPDRLLTVRESTDP